MSHVNCVRIGLVAVVAIFFRLNNGQVLRAAVGTLADSSGEVVAWGFNFFGQTNVPSGTFIAIAAGGSNHSLGIRSDGFLAAWGNNSQGQTTLPFSFSAHTAVAAGGFHSLAIRSDATLVGWGNNDNGQSTVPSGTFTAIAAGGRHSLAIKSDGTLAGWGDNTLGLITVPGGTFTAIAAGDEHGLGMKSDGTLIGWGDNFYGQTTVPSGTFTAIAAGLEHNLAIKPDGTLVGWGRGSEGQITIPSGTFTAIAGGGTHSLGIRSDGTLAGWGNNSSGQTTVPSGTFTAIAAGRAHCLALRARTDYDGDLLISGNNVSASLNRSINVAGNATVQTTTNFYNSPTAIIGGKLILAPGAEFSGDTAGTIIANGLDVQTDFTLPASFSLDSTGPLAGAGSLTLGSNSHVNLALAPISSYSGALSIQSGATLTLTETGLLKSSALKLANGGELRQVAGQRVVVSGAGDNSGKIELLGTASQGTSEIEFRGATLNASSTGLITGHTATLRFSGGLTNKGSLSLTGGTNDVFGDIANSGSIVVSGGAGATFYDDVDQGGTLRVSQVGSTTSTAVFLGDFTGEGGSTGGGDIFFEGDLRPGNSPAQVTYENNVFLGSGSTLEIELGGLMPGAQYDKIIVDGSLTLDGALNVSLINSFTPQAGNSFDILDWDNLAGTFDTLALPTLTGSLIWDTNQLYTTGVLAVVAPGVPGDYNGNGTVDAADYVVWRTNDGTQTGYDTWRANFGRAASSGAGDTGSASASANPLSATVPEPASARLFGLATAALIVSRRTTGRSRSPARRFLRQ
jgi:peptidyl-tRNA hydrolase